MTLGFDSPEPYIKGSPFFGSLVGRYGNRIGGGQFTLDGKIYSLPRNNGPNTLHGGTRGFDKVLWTGREVAGPSGPGVELAYVSPDGDQGFPGTLRTRVVYSLNDAGELRIEYEAMTDKPTVVNLTNHAYFNLAGPEGGDILGHILFIDADHFTVVGPGLIPTGEQRSVAGHALRLPHPHRDRGADRGRARAAEARGRLRPQLRPERRGGEAAARGSRHGAALGPGDRGADDRTGGAVLLRQLPGRLGRGPGGQGLRASLRLLPGDAAFPDSPNQPSFPSTVLRPGGTYRTTTIYRLTTVP